MEEHQEEARRKIEAGDEINPTAACLHKQPDNFISTKQFAKKYGLEYTRKLSWACRKGALIADKRLVPGLNKRKGTIGYRWYILDIPPQEHPDWAKYEKHLSFHDNKFVGASKYDKDFDSWAPIFLERFDEARKELDYTKFRITELARIINIRTHNIIRWTDHGIEGYGRLPKIEYPDDKRAMIDHETGRYISLPQVAVGRIDYYYDTKDIRRFLKKELADPNNFKQFKTLDDALSDTNADQIAEKHGYYVYDPAKCSPLTYEGFIRWAEDNIKFYDKTARRVVPFRANLKQREFYKNAFTIDPKTGLFKYKIICTSRPRGEYKSFDVILLFIFRLFNMPEEQIFLVANSERQTTHLLFDEAVKIIRRSPRLLSTKGLDIQSKGIYLMAGKKEVYSFIEVMSVESGARSNATCFAFSEIWKLTDEKNFAEIEQSIRGVDNAWVLIESTVASKGHVFWRLYDAYIKGLSKITYFQYYFGEHHNPKIDQEYFDHLKVLYPHLYRIFWDNKWEDAATGLFDKKRIAEINILSLNNSIMRTPEFIKAIDNIVEMQEQIQKHSGVTHQQSQDIVINAKAAIHSLQNKMKLFDDIISNHVTTEEFDRLRQIYDCDFIIGIGIDRAKQLTKKSDRTAVATIAKGILGEDKKIYILLDLYLPDEPKLINLTGRIIENSQRYGWIDKIHIEEYQGQDLHGWCIDNGFSAELSPSSFRHQEEIFSELSIAVDGGYFKCRDLHIWQDDRGNLHYSKPPDGKLNIMLEEMSVFEYEIPAYGKKAGYFGSPYKKATHRTKEGEPRDDTVYAVAHAVMAANTGEIPASTKNAVFSEVLINRDTIGSY